MARIILNFFVLLLVVITFAFAWNPPPSWGGPGGDSTTTKGPIAHPPNQGTCPIPTEEMLKCVRQWACQYLIRLDLRCLLNLNGLPLVGNSMGDLFGNAGGSQSQVQLPGILGNTGNALLGGSGGILGGLLG